MIVGVYGYELMELLLGNLNYSSWSIRAALVARASGVEFDEVIIPLDQSDTTDILIAKTGQRRVPALIVDDLVIHDSLAITEWIAETAEPGRVWPLEAQARARARSLCAEMHASFIDLRSFMGVDIRARHPTPEMTPGLKGDVERIRQIFSETLAQYSGDGPFLFGEWSAADAFYMPVVTRFRTYGVALEGRAASYAEAVLAHPLTQQIEAAAAIEPWTLDPLKFQPKTAD